MIELLETFVERRNKLEAITRYSLYSPMFYRTNLWIHSHRVSWLVREFAPGVLRVFPEFDTERACLMALIHDDIEIIIGDIQAGNKSKMSPEERAELKKKELEAIPVLTEQFSDILDKKLYESLIHEVFDKKTLESIIVEWADKFDAFGEVLHELYAGNIRWTIPVVNEYGIIPLPADYYIDYFKKFEDIFPISRKLFEHESKFFYIPNRPDPVEITKNGKLHSKESIQIKQNYGPYDFWIATTLKFGREEDISNLYQQKEVQ